MGDSLLDRIREMTATRIHLEDLLPPTHRPPLPPSTTKTEEASISTVEARKVVRAARVEAAQARLRETCQSCVSYFEYGRVCVEIAGGTEEAVRLVTTVDDSAAVIVFGDVVHVRPEMASAAPPLLPLCPLSLDCKARSQAVRINVKVTTTRREHELKKMEGTRTEIEVAAVTEVRREL